MQTIIGLNDPKAVKRWSASLFVDAARESYYAPRFFGRGETAMAPIQILTQLEKEAGDTIKYDLSMQLRNKPVYGDDKLKGKEEQLRFLSDEVKINQVRCGVSAGGRMTRKRVLHDLRMIAKARMAEWWARYWDETLIQYTSGARGINDDFIEDVTFTGIPDTQTFQAPDADHLIFGDGTSKATLTSAGILTLTVLERLVTRVRTLGGGTTGVPEIRPIKVDGEDRYVFLMHEYQEYSLRNNTNTGQWLDIQKAASGATGTKSPIFTGNHGMYRGLVLHSHKIPIRFNDYGAGVNLPAARGICFGRQGGVVAHGSAGGTGLRYDWNEETDDRGNEVIISSSTIVGINKSRFNSKDFGTFAVDTYAATVT